MVPDSEAGTGGFGPWDFLPLPSRLFEDEGRTDVVIPVNDLAVHAVEAFVGIDLAQRMDGLDHAVLGAELALVAALLPAFQPVEHVSAAGDRERGAKDAEVAAIETLDKEPGGEKP